MGYFDMCGRYVLEATKKELWERYSLGRGNDAFYERNGEIFPTNAAPIILPGNEWGYEKWGFTESFSNRPLINARAETILEKPTFRQPFMSSRCLIPATSFFEWEKKGKEKIKRKITVGGIPIFSMAGILKTYTDGEGGIFARFSIITTEANQQMTTIHDRMPVILNPEDEQLYLDRNADPKRILQLLKPTTHTLIIS